MALLQVDDLVAGYGKAPILHGVSLTVDRGEVLAVIGPNGAGKSTLVKAIFGLCDVFSGSVRLEGQRLNGLRPSQVVAHGLAYMPQIDNVFPTLSVRENLEMGGFTRSKEVAGRIDELTAMFRDLGPALKRSAGDLSGGQRTMLAMARALMTRPSVLLLDEPTAGTAPLVADRIWEHVEGISASGTTVLIVEQNARRALQAAHRGLVLTNGRVAREGTGRQLLDSEDIVQLFLGIETAH